MSRPTIFLARLFGLFMVVVALWMLVDERELSATLDALVQDRPATLLFSLMCLGCGLAVVLGHQIWSGGIAPVLVTLLGWLLLVRGVALLFVPPNLLESLANAVSGPALLYPLSVVALGLGLILTYAGFRSPPIVSARQ
jgi:hypothetical protein